MGTGGVRQDERTDTELVLAVQGHRSGAASPDPDAFGVLFDRWYDRCWNVARNIMRSDDLAAEVAQDAMLAGWQRIDQLRNPEAFGGWLLRITRNRALTRLEREGRSRATGDEIVSAMRDRNISQQHDEPLGAQAPPSVEAAMEIHDRQELVWAASAALGERDASLLDLHLRHGLTPAEIAEELGVEANAAHQQLFRLRNKLGDAIGAYLLWRNGRTLCRGLAAAVSGDVAFDRSVARAVARHQKHCEECAERRAGLVSPTKLFASVPFLVVPFQFKLDAAAALAEAGVPIDPSTIAAAGPPSGPPSGPTQGPSPHGSGPGPHGSGPGSTSGAPTGEPTALLQSPAAPAEKASPTGSTSATDHGVLGTEAPPDLPGPSAEPAYQTSSRLGFGDGLGWTTARSAWLKSLGGAAMVVMIGLILIGVLPGLAFSDLWPFGGESSSIGSETLAGPVIDESSTTTAAAGTANALGGSPIDSADSSTAGSNQLLTPESTSSSSIQTTASSAATTATSAATTPTTATTSSTAETTETTSSTTATSTDTTETTDTTATTTDTSRTTSTDQDTTSSSTETTQTTQTTDPPPPPSIVRFTSRVGSVSLRCSLRQQRNYEAIWATENTTSVELFLPNGTSVAGQPNGVQSFCGRPGDSISLVARGPGGDDKASTTLN